MGESPFVYIGGGCMLKIYKKLSWFFRQEKKRYVSFFIISIALSLLEILPPQLLGQSLDQIAQASFTKEELFTTIIIMSLIAILIYIGYNLRGRLLMYGSFKLQYLLRNQLMDYLSSMDGHYYANHETGDLMAVATADINAICMAASRILSQILSSTFMMSVVLSVMVLTTNWKLTAITILPLPISIVVIYKLSNKARQLFVDARNAFGEFNNTTLESVAGVSVVRAFVQEENDFKKLEKAADLSKDKELKAMKLDAAFGPLFRCVFAVASILAISYGVFLVYEHQISAGELVTFNIYLGMLRMPLWSCGMVLNALQRAQASYERFEKTTTVNLQLEKETGKKIISQIDEIEFKNYSFTYPNSEFESLKDISFKIKKGMTVGIAGKTGSGKTTLLLQLLRFYAKGEGSFLINQLPVQTIDYMNLRQFFGYVPQEHILFSKTVRENIALGYVGKVSDEKINEAIELADFKKDLQFLKDGLNTLCGEDGTMLSGGQKQRLSIARAFLKNPEVLLLDDSLSAVDGKTESTIVENLKNKRKNRTTIIVAHRLSAIRHADLIIVLDQGKIVDMGTHQSLLQHGGWYKKQYENQILAKEEVYYEKY